MDHHDSGYHLPLSDRAATIVLGAAVLLIGAAGFVIWTLL